MGLLSLFTRSPASSLVQLPQASFTMDREGRIIVSTLPQGFPLARALEIGQAFLAFFRSAVAANLPLTELTVDYPALKLKAREMRGGVIVFLSPQGFRARPRR